MDKGLEVTQAAIRRERWIALLPKHRYAYTPAAKEAGYSDTYAKSGIHKTVKNDIGLQKRIKALIDADLQKAENTVKALDEKLKIILDTGALPDGTKLSPTAYHSFMRTCYQRYGALSGSNVEHEEPVRITKEQREAARKASIKLLSEKYGQTA